jgi:hypothetical protein
MMKKKPTRKYAVGGMTPTQTDKVNAANMAAMQKANAAAKSSAPTQAAKVNAASMAAMQKANAAANSSAPKMPAVAAATPNVRPATAVPQKPTPVGPPRPVPAVPTTKEKAQYLKAARGHFREDRKSGALKENVQAQKKNMRVALKSGVVPKEARKSVRDEIKNTNVKSVVQGVRSRFQENRKAIQAERANNKAIRKSLKGKSK